MLRRSFLQSMGAGAVTLFLPPPGARAATALPRYWLNLHAGGGMCALSSYDPYPAPVRSFSQSSITQHGVFSLSPFLGAPSNYPDPTTGRADTQGYYTRFFDKYKDRLLLIRGVDNQSGDHPTAANYAMTGGLALPYPNFTALAAAVLNPSLPMAYIGGNTQGIIGGSQADMGTLRAASQPLLRMASPNLPDPANGNNLFQMDSTWREVEGAINSRLARLQGQERVAFRAQQRALMQVARSNTDNTALIGVLNNLFSKPVNPNASAATIDVLIGCFQAGLALGATLDAQPGALFDTFGNFDSHADHDARQYPLLDASLRVLDYAIASADAAGLNLNIMLSSDFGRTAGYGGGTGTDHNPAASSYMFIGPDFKGGRVVGATTIDPTLGYIGLPINATNLQEDPNGVHLTAAHIHAALRQVSGIDKATLSQRFTVSQPVLPLFAGP